MMRFFCRALSRQPTIKAMAKEVLVSTGATLGASLFAAGAYKTGSILFTQADRVFAHSFGSQADTPDEQVRAKR